MVNWACADISFPRSQVSERLSSVCIDASACANALFIDTAPYPDSAGPFLVIGCARHPCSRGRCTRVVYPVVRSTMVPIADLSADDDEITFVVPGDRTVVGFFGTLADEYVRCHMGPGNAFRSRAWHPKSAAGAQAQDEFAAQAAATLDE